MSNKSIGKGRYGKIGDSLGSRLKRNNASKRREDLLKGDIFVLQGCGPLYYFYSYDLAPGPPYHIPEELLKKGRQTLDQVQQEMSKDDLHVTMWFKQTPGPDDKYWAEMQRCSPTKITTDYLYTDNQSSAVATVLFGDQSVQNKLYQGHATPHISLFKEKHQTWQGLGRTALMGKSASDWQETIQGVWHSNSTGLTRVALFWHASVKAEVHLQLQQTT